MRRVKNVFLIVGILCSTILLGQNRIELGIEGGGSLISLRGDGFIVDHNVDAISFTTGFSMLYHFDDHFSLKTNLLYERKGNDINFYYHDLPFPIIDIYIPDELEIKYRLEYLTLPVLARYSFGNKKNFFVNAGGYVGYLLRSRTISNNIIEPYERIEMENTDRFNRLDFGLSAGVGGQIHLSNDLILSMELRHNLGLKNIGIDEAENYNYSKDLIIKKDGLSTNATSLLIGLSYRLSKPNNN